MRNRLLILIFVALATKSLAQAPADEHTLHICADNYMKGAFELKQFERAEKELKECMIGKKFPSFSATAMDGKKYSSADLKNKVVLVSCWFIGCAPCVAEIPVFNELNQEFKGQGFILLTFTRDQIEYLTKFIKEKSINYTVFPNADELIERKWKMVYGYPANFILSKKGEIVEFSGGGPTDEPGLQLAKEKFRKIIIAEVAK